MQPQDNATVISTGLLFRNGCALAILIITILSFVSRASAAPATALKGVHDTFHKALRDADAAPLDQLLAGQFVWTDGEGHVWNKSDFLKQLRDRKLRYSDFHADLESLADYRIKILAATRDYFEEMPSAR